jgi:thiol-disulfide isomerase/thioredoxin
MKKFLSMLAAVLVAASAFAQQMPFNVKIGIKGVSSTKAYITVFGDEDSVHIAGLDPKMPMLPVSDGVLTLTGTTSVQSVLRISLSGEKRLMKMVGNGFIPVKSASMWLVLGPGTNLDVEGDLTGKDYVDIYPNGDPENRLMAVLNAGMMPVANDEANLEVKEYTDSTLTSEDKKALEARIADLDQNAQKVRENFINSYPSCIASLWIMEDMLVRSQIEPAALEAPLASAKAKYGDNYFYKAVTDRLAGAKSAAVGAKCPDVSGTDKDGKEICISDFRGKYLIVDFWGTWCGACLAGVPEMRAFRDAHKDKVQILGVANDKDVEKWKACMKKNDMTWPNIMEGTGDRDYVARFNVQGFPTKILVDPEGTIVYRFTGEDKEFYVNVERMISNR